MQGFFLQNIEIQRAWLKLFGRITVPLQFFQKTEITSTSFVSITLFSHLIALNIQIMQSQLFKFQAEYDATLEFIK